MSEIDALRCCKVAIIIILGRLSTVFTVFINQKFVLSFCWNIYYLFCLTPYINIVIYFRIRPLTRTYAHMLL